MAITGLYGQNSTEKSTFVIWTAENTGQSIRRNDNFTCEKYPLLWAYHFYYYAEISLYINI